MEILLVKKFGLLHPYDPSDADKIAQMRTGEVYKAKVSMPRNVRFHRKYFALLRIVLDNMPEDLPLTTLDGHRIEIKTTESLLWHIKMQLGHYEEKMTLGGRKLYEAKSISFSKMDEAEFQEFYNRSLDVILKYFLPGTAADEIEEIVMSFM